MQSLPFVAVSGRCRIRKAYLIREGLEHSFTFEHTGVSNSDLAVHSCKAIQFEKFQESIAEFEYKPSEKITSCKEAFNGLKEVIKASKEKKKVIFIDELHNRLTGRVHLRPFNLNECKQYLESRKIVFSSYQILMCYMILVVFRSNRVS